MISLSKSTAVQKAGPRDDLSVGQSARFEDDSMAGALLNGIHLKRRGLCLVMSA